MVFVTRIEFLQSSMLSLELTTVIRPTVEFIIVHYTVFGSSRVTKLVNIVLKMVRKSFFFLKGGGCTFTIIEKMRC